ncbi:MAG TPA: heparinase II/III family protein, partial [Pyrinomonadaceae bacterium]|nr:heparinase II/III family protein [Pyrinomonadaceae bacterium]
TITACERLAWIEHPRFTFVSGRHRGFEQLSPPGIHTRSILFLKHDYWVIRDRIELTGRHQVDLWFHFDSGALPENGAKIASFAPGGRWTTEEGWVSHCYGERAPAPVRVFSATADGAFEIITFLLPGELERTLEEIEIPGGRGFEIRSEHYRDLLIVKNVEYTWQRTVASGGPPEEIRFSATDYADPNE